MIFFLQESFTVRGDMTVYYISDCPPEVVGPFECNYGRGGFTLKGGIMRLTQELVEKLLHTHTNLVLRESLDTSENTYMVNRDFYFL